MRIRDLCVTAHEESRRAGWYDTPTSDGDKIALMHSELSEAMEEIRKPNPDGSFRVSEKIPKFTGLCEEIADLVIRAADFAGHHDLPLEDAISAKLAYNRTRGHKHGGKKL